MIYSYIFKISSLTISSFEWRKKKPGKFDGKSKTAMKQGFIKNRELPTFTYNHTLKGGSKKMTIFVKR